jgi:hypothetical protein
MERYATTAMPRASLAGRALQSAVQPRGPQKQAGDYLYYSGRASRCESSWGLFRVFDELQGDLKPAEPPADQKSAPSSVGRGTCEDLQRSPSIRTSGITKVRRCHGGRSGRKMMRRAGQDTCSAAIVAGSRPVN